MKNRIKQEGSSPISQLGCNTTTPTTAANNNSNNNSNALQQAYPSITATYWLPSQNTAPYIVPGNFPFFFYFLIAEY